MALVRCCVCLAPPSVRLAPSTVLQPISARQQRSLRDTCGPIGERSLGWNNMKRGMQLLSFMGGSKTGGSASGLIVLISGCLGLFRDTKLVLWNLSRTFWNLLTTAVQFQTVRGLSIKSKTGLNCTEMFVLLWLLGFLFRLLYCVLAHELCFPFLFCVFCWYRSKL